MAHVSTREYWDIDGSGDDKGVRVWTRAFKVIFNTIVHAGEALDAPGIPVRWGPHPSDFRMTARNATAKKLQSDPYVWLVTVEYSSQTGDEERGADDPRLRPTDVESDFSSYQRTMHWDMNGKAVLNSAGDGFDPEYQMEDSRPILRFRRFEANWDFGRSLSYRNAVNTDSFFGMAAGEVMCMYIKQRRHFENQIECWDTSYEFQGKENGQVLHKGNLTNFKGWDAVLLDQGYNELVSGQRAAILTEKAPKVKVSCPVRLDGLGKALLSSEPFEKSSFSIFRPPYRYRSFAALGLP